MWELVHNSSTAADFHSALYIVVDNGVVRRPRAKFGVSGVRHDPQCCGHATRFSTSKSHGCSPIYPQGERATFTCRKPPRFPPVPLTPPETAQEFTLVQSLDDARRRPPDS